MHHFVVRGLSLAIVLAGSALAEAQEATDQAPAAEGAAPAEATTAASAAPTPAAPTADTSGSFADGPRFRFGVSGGVGFFTAASEAGNDKASFTYFGSDVRLGLQINDLIGVYAQPTLGYYAANGSGGLLPGGLLGLAVAADVTLIDRFFVGAGIGYTLYNNPAGISPLLRVGGYPLMSRSDRKARRKGLMLGVDLRFTSLDQLKTIVMPTFNVGYEAF